METVTTRELTCIGCPMGCPLIVTMEAGEVISVTGNTCKRGDVYARKEVTNPTRIVTSTVRVSGGDADMVSVKTKEDIPKGKIFECVKALNEKPETEVLYSDEDKMTMDGHKFFQPHFKPDYNVDLLCTCLLYTSDAADD